MTVNRCLKSWSLSLNPANESHLIMKHKHLIIWLLAGFLITYHTVKMYTGLAETGHAATVFTENYYENTVRLWIVASLLLVIMFKPVGVVSMWLSIGTLVVIQMVSLTGTSLWLDYLLPLKGFIFPLLITLVFWQHRLDQE